MLDQLTIEQFEPHVGSTFHLRLTPEQVIDLRLDRAARVMESEAARLKRTAFSLFFSGPPQPVLPQQIYRIEHEVLGGGQDIFIVPVKASTETVVYEAVFS